MKGSYPYLRDPRSIAEIRKHQWIESEKAGYEIGFGTAAIDWVAKYGRQWEVACAKIDKNVFIENRKFRRFEFESYVALTYENKTIIVRTIDISSLGLLCIAKESLHPEVEVTLQWSFNTDNKSGIIFDGKISRVWPRKNNSQEFELLIKFDEQSRKKIETFYYLLNS
ncbi:MAG: PilZ domain-containing protein [Candidatus Omnitrophica bacterium]|nr:PilZ domain-containing protein [Candidatus Omnitrophota bacterium]